MNPLNYQSHNKSIASARAGNVIGGGDWALDRIIPDCIRAIEGKKEIEIRSPQSIRPWQHVLEPLSGYLLLAQKMWENPTKYCQAWNFGPNNELVSNVWSIASKIVEYYGEGSLKHINNPNAQHEAKILMLDISKARFELEWKPKMNLESTVEMTVDWYKRYKGTNVYDICTQHISKYLQL